MSESIYLLVPPLLAALIYCLTRGAGWRPLAVVRPRYATPRDEAKAAVAAGRLFRDEDFAYLRSSPRFEPALERYLRVRRAEALAHYLRQARRRFDANAAVVRRYAEEADSPGVAVEVWRQSARFYLVWAAMRVALALGFARAAARFTLSLTRASVFDASIADSVADARSATR